METLKLSWLGYPQVELKGQLTKLKMRKATAMLGYLSLEARESPRELLSTILWPEGNQQKALANLRRTLSSLNGSLPGWLEADRDNIDQDGSASDPQLKDYANRLLDALTPLKTMPEKDSDVHAKRP